MTIVHVIGLVAAGIAAVAHLAFFVLESMLFTTPRGRRLFGVRAEHDSPPLRLFAVNQGIYNLALAAIVIVGIVMVASDPSSVVGRVLVIAGCSVMTVAAVALGATAGRRLVAAALAQGIPPLVAIVALAAGLAP